VRPSAVGLPGRREHPRPALDERSIGESLALKPLFDRLSRLLGQLAGVALLASAGTEPDRQLCHLAVIKTQLQSAREAHARLDPPQRLTGTFHAMGQTLALIDEIMARLDRRPAIALLDDDSFAALTQALSAARRRLLSGSAAGLGIVDFAGACCALGH
jgi:hypothetical protein